jgi:broad specificity phosphatase PhoE
MADPELTLEGQQMAEDFVIAYHDVPFNAIYSSPLLERERRRRQSLKRSEFIPN